jgi:hypothetical protein
MNRRGRKRPWRCICHHGSSCCNPLARRSSSTSRSVARTSCSSLDANTSWTVLTAPPVKGSLIKGGTGSMASQPAEVRRRPNVRTERRRERQAHGCRSARRATAGDGRLPSSTTAGVPVRLDPWRRLSGRWSPARYLLACPTSAARRSSDACNLSAVVARARSRRDGSVSCVQS